MFKNRNITEFFKPFANPRPTKRARYDEHDHSQEIETQAPGCSSSPRLADRARNVPTTVRPSLEDLTTSSLSSLPSDDSTLFIPDEDPQDIVEQDIVSSIALPVLASSQRVSRNGEIMIRNSDDDTDSEVSLADIGDILVGNKSNFTSSPLTEPDLPPIPKATRLRASARDAKSRFPNDARAAKVPLTLPATAKYKFSLASLVAKAEQDDATDEGTAKARQLIESLEDRRAALEAKVDEGRGIKDLDIGLLASVVRKEGDDGTIDKLMQAIERTEALSMQKCWSFFEHTPSEKVEEKVSSPEDFPPNDSSLLPGSLSNIHIACVNGYLGEVAARGKLPDELFHWILDTSSTEPTEDLRRAYVSTLSQAEEQAKSNISPSLINMLFRKIGAKKDALNLESPIEPTWRTPIQDDELRAKGHCTSGLRNVLKLLSGVAALISPESRVHSLCVLCRILVDTCFARDRTNLEAAEDAFECLVSSIPESRFEADSLVILNTTFSKLKDAQLRLQMLRCIPATTLRLSLLRRRLSIAFFFDNPSYLAKQSPDFFSIRKTIAQLRKPEYLIGTNTDYPQLAAAIAILDIGLDDGDPPDFALDLDLEEKFNEKIDRLAEVLKAIVSKIADAGASFMSRTEAKDGLEAFHNRLVYAVRTKPRPKNLHFGKSNISSGNGVSSGEFMSRFLSSRKATVDVNFV
ncbi:hypothetical protein MMC11_000701 [Xylographa trunciseda]|nr:hypothetical protein [Xylographa trunciseda]